MYILGISAFPEVPIGFTVLSRNPSISSSFKIRLPSFNSSILTPFMWISIDNYLTFLCMNMYAKDHIQWYSIQIGEDRQLSCDQIQDGTSQEREGLANIWTWILSQNQTNHDGLWSTYKGSGIHNTHHTWN